MNANMTFVYFPTLSFQYLNWLMIISVWPLHSPSLSLTFVILRLTTWQSSLYINPLSPSNTNLARLSMSGMMGAALDAVDLSLLLLADEHLRTYIAHITLVLGSYLK
jgi:hypothetical protein